MRPILIVEAANKYEDCIRVALERRLVQSKYEDQLKYLGTIPAAIRDLVRNDDIEPAMRWLGFVQGALWMMCVYTMEEIKLHNRGHLYDRSR